MKQEIIITGFGGQGIVLAGRVLGNAAAIGDNRESTLIQSYGPESRGGACSAQVIISDAMIHYPYIRSSDVLVAMSQSGYEKYIDQLKDDGMLLYDQDLVQPLDAVQGKYAIPATRLAEELGRKMMANIIMIGFITAITFLTEIEDIERFGNSDHFAGFIGLVPNQHSSGDKKRIGEMTFRGQDTLKKAIIESSWFAARLDPALTKSFHSYLNRMDANKAIIRIARKVLNRMYFVLKNKMEYVPSVVK